MAITPTIGISIKGPFNRRLGLSTINIEKLTRTGWYEYSKFLDKRTTLAQFTEFIQTLLPLSQIDGFIKTTIGLSVLWELLIEQLALITYEAYFNTTIGLNSYDNLVEFAPIDVIDKFGKINLTAVVEQLSRFHETVGPLYNLDYGPLIETTTITATDIFGPRLINIIPPSGSTYNNPFSNITFTLIDQEQTTINTNEVDFYIQGIQVISGGIDVTPTLFGTTGFQQVNDFTYNFIFAPVNPFSPDEPISVSGKAHDTNIPVNISEFDYSLRVWQTDDLQGNIVGTEDVLPPFITNQSPAPGEIGVLPDTDIEFDLVDIHTGVDPDSVVIKINDLPVLSGLYPFNLDKYSTTRTTVSGGYRYVIDPVGDFDFDTVVTIDVSCHDKYTPNVNHFSTSYSFLTYNNSYLTISGLSVYSEDQWVETEVSKSYYITQTGIDFSVYYVNTSGTGIDMVESEVWLNNEVVSGTTIDEIVTGYSYLVNFNIFPDYTTDMDLVFHVVESGTISGVTVYNNYRKEVLLGAEICYDPESDFKHNQDIPVYIQVKDRGDWYSIATQFYKLKIEPERGHSLYGVIQALPVHYTSLLAEISSNNPYFEYGKTMNMRLLVKDFAGNELDYVWDFTIQEK